MNSTCSFNSAPFRHAGRFSTAALSLLCMLLLCLSSAALGEPKHGEGFDEPHEHEAHSARHGGPPEHRGRLTDEQAEAALEVLGELYPDTGERMWRNWEENPNEVRRMLERRFPRVRYLVALRERNPEMYELRISDLQLTRQTQQLGKELRHARKQEDPDDDAIEELEDELEEAVEEHFEVRQELREMELEALHDRIEQMEDQLKDRSRDRRELIEQRLLELAGGEHGTSW